MAVDKKNKLTTIQRSGFYWNKSNLGAEGELNKKSKFWRKENGLLSPVEKENI